MSVSRRGAVANLYRSQRPAIARGFLIALGATVALLWFVQPTTLAHRLIRTDVVPTDSAYVGRMIAVDPHSAAPDVLVLGGSSMQLMIPRDANTRMRQLCGRDIHLFNAASSSQHPSASWAIVDALRRPPSLIVVGLSYRRLMRTPFADPYRLEQQRVELPRSPTMFRAALLRGRLDAGLFDSLAQLKLMDWERRLFVATVRGHGELPIAPGARHEADLSADTVRSPSDKQMLADTMEVIDGNALARSVDEMTRFWIDFAHAMAARGSRTLFVMTPYSREADSMTRAYAQPLSHAMNALGVGAGLPAHDMRDIALSDDEFRDPIHLTYAARDRIWPSFSRTLARSGGCAATPR